MQYFANLGVQNEILFVSLCANSENTKVLYCFIQAYYNLIC